MSHHPPFSAAEGQPAPDHRFESGFALVAVLTPAGEVAEISRVAFEGLAVGRDAALGRPFWLGPWWFGEPERQDDIRAAVARAAAGETVRLFTQVRGRGEGRMSADLTLRPVGDGKGHVAWILAEAAGGYAHRATEAELHRLNRQLEQRIAERTERMRLMIESSAEAVVTVDHHGVVEEWNGAAERIFGWSRSEVVGQRLSDIIIPHRYRAAHDAGIRRFLATGQATVLNRTIELSALRRGGEEFPVELSVWPVRSGESYVFSAFLRDITERKRALQAATEAEAEVRKALAREQELNELKSRFVSMTSHEFRTPLTAIFSSAELLETYGERLGPDQRAELYGIIKTAVRNMTQLLEEVLFIGKSDTGHLQFNPQPTDLGGFCGQLLKEVRAGVGKEHHIVYTATGDASPVQVDTHLLRQIVLNLLGNAIKFSPKGATVSLAFTRNADGLVFEITDQGVGIPPEDRPNLFNTFHRARNVNHIQGTGLGLAIVKKCVDLHGGEITYDSELGRGTRFLVRLPLRG